MSDAYIPRIPDEIWEYVFEALEITVPSEKWWQKRSLVNESQRRLLLSLCLVCHQFRRCAQRLLSKALLLDGAEPHNDRKFIRALRELALRPGFGQNTRILTVDNNFGTGVHDLQVDNELLASAINLMDLPPRFRQFLESSHFEAQSTSPAPLCLLFTPNVELLEITLGETPLLLSWFLSGSLELEKSSFLSKTEDDEPGNADYGDGYADDKVVVRAYANFGLPRLKKVHLKNRGVGSATPITDIEAAFLHPGVEIMRTRGLDWRAVHIPKRRWPNVTSSIRTLELTECIMDARSMEDMLLLCPKLEYLKIVLADRGQATGIRYADYWINMNSVGKALRRYGQNLAAFDLYTPNFSGYLHGAIGSLQDLHKLRDLKITQRDLIGKIDISTLNTAVPHFNIDSR
ncbi:unnamed protein product [Clonostachys rosea]|uniref:F-box domain-containing protein n=1 Tax=Bionectria ochroleuca TaxID=29856 RepID=A0ABY6U1Q3_BIOOC|nr:unnamed protein product [Clonostachys rosea]